MLERAERSSLRAPRSTPSRCRTGPLRRCARAPRAMTKTRFLDLDLLMHIARRTLGPVDVRDVLLSLRSPGRAAASSDRMPIRPWCSRPPPSIPSARQGTVPWWTATSDWLAGRAHGLRRGQQPGWPSPTTRAYDVIHDIASGAIDEVADIAARLRLGITRQDGVVSDSGWRGTARSRARDPGGGIGRGGRAAALSCGPKSGDQCSLPTLRPGRRRRLSGLARFARAARRHDRRRCRAHGLARRHRLRDAGRRGSRQVALFLLLTMAPSSSPAPLIGPILDRFRHGRR